MVLFEIVVGLLLIGSLCALWANRIGAPYPALLALAGVALALVPGTPRVMLDPSLALALFVAPVLLDAAYDASPRDLKRNLSAVTNLAILLVLFTLVAVAAVARWCVPGMGWAAAIALGAIVAPPDAAAASAVLRKLRPPHRVLVILEGESLFNDATALLVYRLAVAAAMTGMLSRWSIVPLLLLSCGGAVVAGIALARLYLWLTARIDDIPVNVLLQFVGTFSVWLIADRVGLSAIITLVAYAMTLARRAPGRTDARRRITSYAVWEVGVLVLNVLAFVLIGLQLSAIGSRLHGADWHRYVFTAGAVCAAVVLVRFAWVMLYRGAVNWLARRRDAHARPVPFDAALVVSWCGMRGIVTLAAALALPNGATDFPYRDLIVLCAFSVVLVTLVVQGLTLRPLMERLGMEDDGAVERELLRARAETARAALAVLEDAPDQPAVRILKLKYESRVRSGQQQPRRSLASGAEADPLIELQRRAVRAQRQALVDLRARNVIGDDAFHAVEEEIDLLELAADERLRFDPEVLVDPAEVPRLKERT